MEVWRKTLAKFPNAHIMHIDEEVGQSQTFCIFTRRCPSIPNSKVGIPKGSSSIQSYKALGLNFSPSWDHRNITIEIYGTPYLIVPLCFFSTRQYHTGITHRSHSSLTTSFCLIAHAWRRTTKDHEYQTTGTRPRHRVYDVSSFRTAICKHAFCISFTRHDSQTRRRSYACEVKEVLFVLSSFTNFPYGLGWAPQDTGHGSTRRNWNGLRT